MDGQSSNLAAEVGFEWLLALQPRRRWRPDRTGFIEFTRGSSMEETNATSSKKVVRRWGGAQGSSRRCPRPGWISTEVSRERVKRQKETQARPQGLEHDLELHTTASYRWLQG